MNTHFIAEAMSSWSLWVLMPVIIIVTGLLSWAIAWACDYFEPAASYIGRKWPPGVKGATVNAVGSSMPEFCTMAALLFFISRPGEGDALLSAGIAVTAGSAIFNSIFIPMLVIFSVLGVFKLKGDIEEISICKEALKRDLTFLLMAEIALIWILFSGSITVLDCLILLTIYVAYAFVLFKAVNTHDGKGEYDDDEYEGWTDDKAWKTLGWTTAVLVVVCYFLGELIIISADAFGVHPMITALFLGAAASSVPDAILSVKDAKKGDYEDAIANAVGSNTFDICFPIGLLSLIYIMINGTIILPEHDAVNTLRVGLLLFTFVVAVILFVPRTIKLQHGWSLASLYAMWTVFVLNTEFHFFM